MKIRHGFVGNSSSSSYIIVLPKSFDFDSYFTDDRIIEFLEQDDYIIDYKQEELTNPLKRARLIKQVREAAKEFIDSRFYYPDYDDFGFGCSLIGLFRFFSVEEIETGSGRSDSMRLLNMVKILEKYDG